MIVIIICSQLALVVTVSCIVAMVAVCVRCIFVRLTGRLQDGFQLGDWQYREETCKQEEKYEEDPDRSDVDTDVNVTWVVHAPG